MLNKTVSADTNSATSTSGSLVPVNLLPVGDAAWTVEFGDRIDPVLHARVLGLAAALEKEQKAEGSTDYSGVVDVVPTFRSLTVHFNPLITDGERLGESLARLAESAGTASTQGRHWRIPVCFDDEYALDLNDLAESKGMSRESVISLMTETTFQVYMIGFMPGFPYMGGLPSVLEAPRLASPRKAVPARSLAVAGAMCAVYPWESPGGWRLLGRTPVPMFSASESDSPSLLASGDRVRWQAVDRSVFLQMEADALAGHLDRKALLIEQEDA
ncbi:MAG: 5-oxoprolinase subunit PxpB [Betaproteobacteria bacterium]